jgi:hypothetical protein
MSKPVKSKSKSSSAEPHFYIALVLKGSEDQYLKLLKYVNGRNGSHIIYQTKSATYLRVMRDERTRFAMMADLPVELAMDRVESK